MKKWVCLLAVLTAASLTLLIAAHVTLYRQRDRVEIYQETLAGDPAAAKGITVTFHDRQGNQLYWDSAIPLGTAEPQAETDFRFYSTSQGNGYFFSRGLEIEFFGAYGYSDLRGIPIFEEVLERMLQALPKDAPLGEEQTATLVLRDFCDYLPIHISDFPLEQYDLYMEDTEAGSMASARELARYLNVVPSADWTVEITYTDYGGSQQLGSSSHQSPPQILAQVTERGLYLCLRTDRPDMLQCRDGVGLWFVPFRSTGRTVKHYKEDSSELEELPIVTLDVDHARVALPFDPYEAEPLALEWSESGEDLLLYLREGEDLVLHVVDAAAGQARQELTLAEGIKAEVNLSFVDAEPSGRVAALSGGTFALVTEEAGRYDLACAGVLEAPAALEEYAGSFRRAMTYEEYCPRALWDGERLVWVSLVGNCNNLHLGFYAAVFDRGGTMTYLGKYTTSRGLSGSPYLGGSVWQPDRTELELAAAP